MLALRWEEKTKLMYSIKLLSLWITIYLRLGITKRKTTATSAQSYQSIALPVQKLFNFLVAEVMTVAFALNLILWIGRFLSKLRLVKRWVYVVILRHF